MNDLLALIFLGVALGLRHGIDWDHIAAITDITGSMVTTEETGPARPGAALATEISSRPLQEARADGAHGHAQAHLHGVDAAQVGGRRRA